MHYIKKFFAINKTPKLLQSDRGKEFDNALLKEYLDSENIKYIRSRPYHPQTNGCLELYHWELHKYMYNELKDKDNINDMVIEQSLDKYILFHNSTKKCCTLYSSDQIKDISNSDLINEIKLNILKKTKKHNISKNEIIDEGEKLLLWNNIKYSKDKYVFVSKDFGNYSYPCLFESYINNNIIKIIPSVDLPNFLKKGEAINVEYSTCIIIPEYC